MRFWAGAIGALLVGVWISDNLDMVLEVFLWASGMAAAVLVMLGLFGLATTIAGAILSTPIALLAFLLGLGIGSGDD